MEFFYTCFVVVIVVNIVLKISKIVYDDKLLKNLLQTTIFVTDNFLKSSLIRVFVVFKYIVLRLHLCFFFVLFISKTTNLRIITFLLLYIQFRKIQDKTNKIEKRKVLVFFRFVKENINNFFFKFLLSINLIEIMINNFFS